MKKKPCLSLVAGLMAFAALLSCTKTTTVMHEKIVLKDNWFIQQSGKLSGIDGSAISGNNLNLENWYPASVPSTVMGTLMANGLYKDIFFADSIRNVDDKQFEQSWWYRTEFTLPPVQEGQHIALNLDGVSYYANIWLNGVLVASRDSIYGTFRRFELDITKSVKDSVNVLAVEIFKQQPGDFGHGFVDWNPAPPDDNMGLWREVFVKISGDVGLKNTFVETDVNIETLDEALLTVHTEVVNHSSRAVNGKLIGNADGIAFSIPVHLKAGEVRQVKITPEDVKALKIDHPRLWWCNTLGEPNLYNLTLQYVTNQAVSDEQKVTFGIREVETYFNAEGHRGFKLNGKEVLIKGAGWTDDIFFRDSDSTNEIQVQYVKHMNLNTIRFENIWGTSQNIYDLCDQYGLMAMVGWSCQWEWENYLGKPCDEYGGITTEADMDLIVESLEHQIRYLQNHPAIIVWMMGSDMLPRPPLEKRYSDLIKSIDNRTYIAAASVRKSEISGATGVKMKGPYNYVGPSYWYIDSVNGGAYGFNTETGPGPQIPVLETLEKMIPANKLWPINEVWNFHCNPSESFGDLSIFNNVLNKRHGQPNNLGNYLQKANVQSFEAMKGMFEAFRANRPNATGIIQWMLNSAWPSLYWQLYDYYLLPTPAYYAAKKANEPLQLVYNYGNHSVYAVNATLKRYENAKARIRLVNLQGKEISSDERVISLEENKSANIGKIPAFSGNVFLVLSLLDESNSQVAENFYWLSDKSDEYDWEKTEWYYSPIRSSADFKALNYLPASTVAMSQRTETGEGDFTVEVQLNNTSDNLAFFMNLTLKDGNQQTVYPVFWEDNYVSLLPGESKTIRCRVPRKVSEIAKFTITLSGWNVKEQIINLSL